MSRKQMVRQLLGASVLAAGACSHFHRGKGPAPAAPAAPAPAQARVVAPPRAPNAPTDANIAAILLAENNTDISYARLAPSRAQSAPVKEFAAQMLADHNGVNRLVNDLLVRIKLDPEDNKTSLDFRDESAARRDQLRELEGRAFDTTYIANEVTYHTKFLSSIDGSLLPSARNPDLRQLLTSIRAAVAAHLAHAEQVRTGLGGR